MDPVVVIKDRLLSHERDRTLVEFCHGPAQVRYTTLQK